MKKFLFVFLILFAGLLLLDKKIYAKPITDFDTFQITTDGNQQNGPLIDNDWVIWTDWRGSTSLDIYGYNLSTQTEIPLITKPNFQSAYGLWKSKILYWDNNTTIPSYRIYDINTGEDIEVAQGPKIRGGSIYANYVVYVDDNFGNLYLHNLKDSINTLITSNVYEPKVYGDKIVWTYNCGGGYYGIKGYNISKQSIFDISPVNDCNQAGPDIYNNTVVWVDFTNRHYKIFEKNLKSGEINIVFDSLNTGLGSPVISQKYIAWINDKGIGAHDVVVKNRKTGQVTEITNNGPQQSSPSIDLDNHTVVWMNWNTGNGDIYGTTLFH